MSDESTLIESIKFAKKIGSFVKQLPPTPIELLKILTLPSPFGSEFAASIISNFDKKIKKNLENWRTKQTKSVKKKPK